MPGLNGLAAATEIKASGSHAKVVFVTNLHDREFVDSIARPRLGRLHRQESHRRGSVSGDS
jgi:DNA-binding NarL/FixJ family response regulator